MKKNRKIQNYGIITNRPPSKKVNTFIINRLTHVKRKLVYDKLRTRAVFLTKFSLIYQHKFIKIGFLAPAILILRLRSVQHSIGFQFNSSLNTLQEKYTRPHHTNHRPHNLLHRNFFLKNNCRRRNNQYRHKCH